MPRKGRDFELLVEQIESSLTTQGVIVKSPDYLEDVTSGGTTEVDISLRCKVGSAEMLVIVECRDRSGKQDKRWIDEIESKRSSVCANKAIAVSRDGFTQNAIKKAMCLGIDTRTFSEVKPIDILEWVNLETFSCSRRNFKVTFVEIIPTDNGIPESMKGLAYKSTDKILFIPSAEAPLSIEDLIKPYVEKIYDDRLIEKQVRNDTPNERTFQTFFIEHENSSIPMLIKLGESQCEVRALKVGLEIAIITTGPKALWRYRGGDDAIAEAVEFDVPSVDGETTVPMSIIFDPSSQQLRVSFRSSEDVDKALGESRTLKLLLEKK